MNLHTSPALTFPTCTQADCQEEGLVDCHNGQHLCETHAKQAGHCFFCGEHEPEAVAFYEGLCYCCYADAVKD